MLPGCARRTVLLLERRNLMGDQRGKGDDPILEEHVEPN